ncbi:MAG: phosphatidylserine decarboxylase [Candidatus Helarchaeota archaeon]|nr:phosphatidylserine decarboxylase [Candidatus Helarchaeota archaeon]
MKVVKEGLWVLIPATIIPIILIWLTLAPWWALMFIFTALMIFFFRDPARVLPSIPNAVFAPADGRIIEILHEPNELTLFVELGLINSHLQRAPIGGTVTKITRTTGKHRILNFFSPKINFGNQTNKAKIDNAQNEIEIELENSKKMRLTQIVGMFARRLKSYVKVGQKIDAGEKVGLIYFGSMVKLQIQGQFELNVQKGAKVKAAKTIIAYVK